MALHRLTSLLVSASLLCATSATAGTVPAAPSASFSGRVASAQVHAVADWTVATNDNQNLPFLIVDKRNAQVFVFDRDGTLQAASAVLLGGARGDVSPPGVGDKKLSQIAPLERITPAGRFIADKGVNLEGRDIVWVDYAAAIAIHRATDLQPGTKLQDRVRRLTSAAPGDRRISFGCINVSDAFYDTVLRPMFAASSGVVYILPDTQSLSATFAMPDKT